MQYQLSQQQKQRDKINATTPLRKYYGLKSQQQQQKSIAFTKKKHFMNSSVLRAMIVSVAVVFILAIIGGRDMDYVVQA